MTLDNSILRALVALGIVGGFFVSSVVAVVIAIQQPRLSARMRTKHKRLWHTLKQADDVLSHSFSSSVTLLQYIMSRDRWVSEDAVLEKYRKSLRRLYFILFPAFFILCVSLVALFTSDKAGN